METEKKSYTSEEQLVYADWLDRGMKLGFVMLVVSFLLYVFGVMTPHVPVDELPNYWHLSAAEYAAATGAPHGWGWLAHALQGDYANFIGIAVLSLVTILCYLIILPILLRRKDTPFVVIAVLEVLVLVLAASGILAAGH